MTEEEIYKQVIGNTEMRKSTSSYEVDQAELDEAINRADVAERRSNELAKEVNEQKETIADLRETTKRLEAMYSQLAHLVPSRSSIPLSGQETFNI